MKNLFIIDIASKEGRKEGRFPSASREEKSQTDTKNIERCPISSMDRNWNLSEPTLADNVER